MNFYNWQLYCVTEGLQTTTLGSDQGPYPPSSPPTQCPNNAAHTVQGPAIISSQWTNVAQVTSTGAQTTTPAMCPAGWHFESRGIQITTSTPSSLNNSNWQNANQGDCQYSFYDSSGNTIASFDVNGKLVTSLLSAVGGVYTTCTKTVVTWMVPYDFVLIRGKVMVNTEPKADCYAHVMIAPNIPASSGGQKPMVTNINLGLMANNSMASYDGVSPKMLSYNNGVGSNAIQWIIYHSAAEATKFEFVIELYRV